jgi:hypothetical protein
VQDTRNLASLYELESEFRPRVFGLLNEKPLSCARGMVCDFSFGEEGTLGGGWVRCWGGFGGGGMKWYGTIMVFVMVCNGNGLGWELGDSGWDGGWSAYGSL